MRLSPFSSEADSQIDRAGKLLVIQVHDGKFGSSPISESCGKTGVGSGHQWMWVSVE